jgi:hypothetical protein
VPKRRKVTKRKQPQSRLQTKKDEGDDSDDMMRIDDDADSDDAPPVQSRRPVPGGKRDSEARAVVHRSARLNKCKKV